MLISSVFPFIQTGKLERCKSDSIQLRLDVRLLRTYKIEDDVAMETAGAADTYGLPCR